MTLLEKSASEIEALIDTWRVRLCGLNSEFAHHKPSSDLWSISEVVGHLVDSACNHHQRCVRAQTSPELTFPAYEQNEWVAAAHYRQGDWESLVELWFHYNRLLAVLIRHIPESKRSVPCTITPNTTCVLEFLVSDYVRHLNHHLTKLNKRIGG